MKLKFPLSTLILVLIPLTVFAQSTFKKDPADRLNFEINPGATITHTIGVINTTDNPVDIELYPTDGIITESGGYSTLPKNGKQEHIGKWLVFKQAKFHLEGKEEKTAEFTITVPPGTTPGSYAGGLSLEPAVVRTELTATGAIVSTRIVIPLHVIVTGERVTSYKWNSFSHKFDISHSFPFSFVNNGNTIIKITGDIALKSFSGETTYIPVGDITLLQKESASISVPWIEKPFFGFYTATANLQFHEFDMNAKKYIEIGRESKTVTFSIIPLGAIATVVLLIAILIVFIVFRKLAHKKYLKRCTTYQAVSGDSLTNIGKKNKVDWKKLAKINKMKPPYDLAPGQKILLPPKK